MGDEYVERIRYTFIQLQSQRTKCRRTKCRPDKVLPDESSADGEINADCCRITAHWNMSLGDITTKRGALWYHVFTSDIIQ